MPRFLSATCLALCLSLSASAQELFRDSFNRPDVRDADSHPRFWSVGGTEGSVEIRNRQLLFTLPGGGPNAQTRTLRSHSATLTFNFFERPATFTVTGLSVVNPQASATVGKNPQNSVFQFYLSPPGEQSPTSANATSDLVGLRIRGNNFIELGFKQNNDSENVFSGTHLRLERRLPASPAIDGFNLTLDAAHYSLILSFANSTTSELFTGPHGLQPDTWGRPPQLGESSLGLVIQSFISSGLANDTVVTLDSLSVTPVR